MASRLKTWAALLRHHESRKRMLERARNGNTAAIASIREHVDECILRLFESGTPFWSNRPASFDADQLDKAAILADEVRLCDLYERVLAFEESHIEKEEERRRRAASESEGDSGE